MRVQPVEGGEGQPGDGRGAREDRLGVWNEFKTEHVFFSSLKLADGGGYSDVKSLFNGKRFPWAAFSVGCLVMNLFFIICPNMGTLLSLPFSEWATPAEADKFLALNSILGLWIWGDRRLQSEVWLAFLELGLLIFYSIRAARSIFKTTRSREDTFWHGVAAILWDDLPELSTFSAMKCLYFVTPKVLLPDTTHSIQRTILDKGTWCAALSFSKFVFDRVLFAFVGFQAFVIKFQMAAEASLAAESFLEAFFAAAAFLNQMLGVVDVNKFVQRRLSVFIFAGEDSFLSDRENMVYLTWRAMLAEKCWQHAADPKSECRPPLLWFLAVTLSYSDDDFQKLTLSGCPRIHDPKAEARRQDKAKAAGQEPLAADKMDVPDKVAPAQAAWAEEATAAGEVPPPAFVQPAMAAGPTSDCVPPHHQQPRLPPLLPALPHAAVELV